MITPSQSPEAMRAQKRLRLRRSKSRLVATSKLAAG